MQWTDERIAGLGWTSTEQLVVLQEDGAATVYDIKGEFVQTFSFGGVRPAAGYRLCFLSRSLVPPLIYSFFFFSSSSLSLSIL